MRILELLLVLFTNCTTKRKLNIYDLSRTIILWIGILDYLEWMMTTVSGDAPKFGADKSHDVMNAPKFGADKSHDEMDAPEFGADKSHDVMDAPEFVADKSHDVMDAPEFVADKSHDEMDAPEFGADKCYAEMCIRSAPIINSITSLCTQRIAIWEL